MDRRRATDPADVYRDKQLIIRRVLRPSGLLLIGAVDLSNVTAMQEVLAASLNGHSDPDVHVDLTRLEFMDVSGIRALVAAAKGADGRHRMIVHGLPPLMSKVMTVVGWSGLPSLVIDDGVFPMPAPSAPGQMDTEVV